jgi:hypothetical protein
MHLTTNPVGGACCGSQEQNVGDPERIGSAIAGGALLLCVLRPKILPGPFWSLAGVALGAGLLVRAATGYCAVYRKFGVNTVETEPASPSAYALPLCSVPATSAPAATIAESPVPTDPVDEASWESFPASDPPSTIVRGQA